MERGLKSPCLALLQAPSLGAKGCVGCRTGADLPTSLGRSWHPAEALALLPCGIQSHRVLQTSPHIPDHLVREREESYQGKLWRFWARYRLTIAPDGEARNEGSPATAAPRQGVYSPPWNVSRRHHRVFVIHFVHEGACLKTVIMVLTTPEEEGEGLLQKRNRDPA